MPSDIIDNRTEKLVDKINQILSGSESAKFAVGYFMLSGFECIKDKLNDIKELKLLIGNTTTQETIEQMAEGYKRLELVKQEAEKHLLFPKTTEIKKRIEETQENLKEHISLMEQTDDAQELIITLANLIEKKKIEVKICTKGRLHAKAYIFDYPTNSPYGKGIGIVGSSNLTLSGIGGVTPNTELNVVISGDANHAELTKWFNELWYEAKPFDDHLLTLLKESWAMNLVRPYDIYIKTLYNLVKDRLEKPEDIDMLWGLFPPLTDFQKEAVEHGIRILQRNNGVFIADVVGLGKSFIGSALLRYFSEVGGFKPIIICPPSLEEMWKEYADKFDFHAPVVSIGDLSQGRLDLISHKVYSERDLVLVDESHNFRYSDTNRYEALQPYLNTRKAIFLTATPRNKSAWDIYHQIKLFHPEDKTPLVDPPSLKEFFDLVEERKKNLPDLLTHLLIRRTRRYIMEKWGILDEKGKKYILLKNKRCYFPKRILKTIEYSIEKVYGGIYEDVRELIEELTFARYGLWNYVIPTKQDVTPYTELKTAGKALKGLMRTMVLKRLESSVEAFRCTINTLMWVHETFVKAIDEKGVVPAGEEAQKMIYEWDEASDETGLMDELEKISKTYSVKDFNIDDLKKDILHDVKILKKIFGLVENIMPEQDDKLQTLIRLMSKTPLDKEKVLIFTQYSDTADYLEKNLKMMANLKMIDSKTKNRLEIVGRFAPISNMYKLETGEEEIRILVSTDVLSEGLNLQDCFHVINYDLHWTPIRLIQRIGRVDRIRTEELFAEYIYAYNFLPETELEKRLGIKEKLRHRIDEIHRTVGEDSEILEKGEVLNENAMYAIYDPKPDTADKLEEEVDKIGGDWLSVYTESEDLIRKLMMEEKKYMDWIIQLPDGIRSAWRKGGKEDFFVFCQGENYNLLYLVDKEGNIKTRDVATIIRALKCDETEKPTKTPAGMNALVSLIKRQFDKEFEQRKAELEHTVRLTLGQRYVQQELRFLLSETKDKSIRHQIETLGRAFGRENLKLLVKKKLNVIKTNQLTGEALLKRLQEIYWKDDLSAMLDEEKEKPSELPMTKIICSEALL